MRYACLHLENALVSTTSARPLSLALSSFVALAACSAAPEPSEVATSAEELAALTRDGLSLTAWTTNASSVANASPADATTPMAWTHWAGAPFRMEATYSGAKLRAATLVASADAWRTRTRTPCTVNTTSARVQCALTKTPAGRLELFVELTSGAGLVGVVPGNYRNHTLEGRADSSGPYFTDSFNTAIGGSAFNRDRSEGTRVARVSTNGQSAGAAGAFTLWSAATPKPVCVRAGQAVPLRVDARDLESGLASVELHASRDGWRTKTVTAMKAVEERQPGWYYAQIGFEAALPALAENASVEATVVARDATGRERWLTDFGRNVVVTTTCTP